jgi:hypothetical protein
VNVLDKSPSSMRVVVIAGAFAVLASAVTPVHAASPVRVKVSRARKSPSSPARVANAGGSARRLSLEWAIGAELRP